MDSTLQRRILLRRADVTAAHNKFAALPETGTQSQLRTLLNEVIWLRDRVNRLLESVQEAREERHPNG